MIYNFIKDPDINSRTALMKSVGDKIRDIVTIRKNWMSSKTGMKRNSV